MDKYNIRVFDAADIELVGIVPILAEDQWRAEMLSDIMFGQHPHDVVPGEGQ
jgi:hypothetical protein